MKKSVCQNIQEYPAKNKNQKDNQMADIDHFRFGKFTVNLHSGVSKKGP